MKAIQGVFLKVYLKFHEKMHERVFHSLAIRYFGGYHPKNIFHYRSEFFLEKARADHQVLDVACGTGRILKDIAVKVSRGLGLDYSERNLELCRQASVANLSFEKADVVTFDYLKLRERFPYNLAIYSHILEHIEDVPALLKKVGAAEILICVPSQENWYRQTLKHLGLNYFTDATHFREYTRQMLREELSAAGYRVSEMGFNSEGEIVCSAALAK